MTAFMGGCELDLRDALMGAGELAVIDVFVMMGGVNIFVPPHWTVTQEIVPLMGGVHDKTHSMPSNPAQHLLIRGTVIMRRRRNQQLDASDPRRSKTAWTVSIGLVSRSVSCWSSVWVVRGLG